MHPLIARYLDPEAARETLRKEKAGEPLSPEEQLFAATAAGHPQQRAELLGVSGRKLSSDIQASLVLLAAHAAARSIAQEPRLAAATAKAQEALTSEGASAEETESFIASMLLEEAFGYEDEVDDFDADYVEEALGEVPALAALTRESVDALLMKFAQQGTSETERTERSRMAKALFDVAWSEGPAPITPEHMETLLEAEVSDQPEETQEARLRAIVELLQALSREGLIGPLRLSRLRAQLGDEDA
ncbi:hypothetical protein [Hyalangium rubrum]|uniref:Uncharacterized protein n=1 Tax=Hyalangium rubrum TaxID=3103134 RepID=A0ABU5H7P7_9BACT|nr:hypothetical protein [Hyalangium sp. s54d21]MDY7228883.1 hypothetical protein [Hyalangium sp. s54d21]